MAYIDRYLQLDPANHKSIIDIQNEAALDTHENRKGKRKAPESENSDDDDDDAMDVDQQPDADDEMVPMPQAESITVLREKLHARVAALRRPGAQSDEPGDKDELLEERRKQRAALREKRRKETRERKKAEAESKNAKGKTKEKETDMKSKPASTKVCPTHFERGVSDTLFRTNCS